MEKILRIILGTILMIIGIGLVALCVSLFWYKQELMTYIALGTGIAVGAGIALGGFGIIRGESIRDILEDIIFNLR